MSETEPAIASWSTAGKAAESRNAFAEALESYQHVVSLITLLPKSSERDRRELEFRQLAFIMLRLTRGFSAPKTIDAAKRAVALRSRNVAQLADWVMSKCLSATRFAHPEAS